MTTLPFADPPAAPAPAPAPHATRIAAALLDAVFSAMLVGAFAFGGFALGLAIGEESASDSWEELGWVLLGFFGGLLMGMALWLVLIVWLVRRPGPRNGQTLGKQLVGLRAVRDSGAEFGVAWVLLRELLAKGVLVAMTASLVSTMLGFLDAGVIGGVVALCIWYGPALFDEQRRGLHDRLCSTRVIVASRTAAPPAPAAADDDLWPAAP